jgi:hypothetical protein
MVCVRLARRWTDGAGAPHPAGDLVDVDAVTLAELEADGVVATVDVATVDVTAADQVAATVRPPVPATPLTSYGPS